MATSKNVGSIWPNMERMSGVQRFTGAASLIHEVDESAVPGVEPFYYKLVFDLDMSNFRDSAEKFNQWRETEAAKVSQENFSMFFRLLEVIVEQYEAAVEAEDKERTAEKLKNAAASDDMLIVDESTITSAVNHGLPPKALRCFMETVFESDEIGADFEFQEGDDVPKVALIRFHAFIFFGKIDIGEIFHSVIASNTKMHKNCENKTMRNKREANLFAQVEEHEFYKHIRSVHMFADRNVGTYTGSDEYIRVGTSGNNCFKSGAQSVAEARRSAHYFPAHPLNVFRIETSIRRQLYNVKSEEHSQNSLQMNATIYNQHSFPIPSAVTEFTVDQISNFFVHCRFLPHYQKFVLTKKAASGLFISSHESLPVYSLAELDACSDAERHRLAAARTTDPEAIMAYGGYSTMDDPELKKAYEDSYQEVRETALELKKKLPRFDDPAFREAYAAFQNETIKLFTARVCGTGVAASEQWIQVVDFYENKTTKDCAMGQVIIPGLYDRHACANLSIFAVAVIERMVEYENIVHVSTAHRLMYLLESARLDAYRYEFEMHFNVILSGAAQVSKSFLFEQMTRFSIPKTVSTVSHKTARADFVDGNRNDQINAVEEMDTGITSAAGTRGFNADLVAKQKDYLTTMVRKSLVYDKKDEHSRLRTNRISTSIQMATYMKATNDPTHNIDPALRSRFLCQVVDNNERPNKSIAECKYALRKHKKEPDFVLRDYKCCLRSQQEQMVVALVFKLIGMGVLCKVNLGAADNIFSRFQAKIGDRILLDRDNERIRMIARIETIKLAFHCVFKVRGGAC